MSPIVFLYIAVPVMAAIVLVGSRLKDDPERERKETEQAIARWPSDNG